MPSVRKFDISLQNSQIVYFPGQYVQGYVLLELVEDIKVKGVVLNCRGKCQIYKKVGKSNYVEKEEYMNSTLVLYGNGPEGGDDVTLTSGNHAFPFKFVLPVGLPGSYEGLDNCYVRYSLNATIGRSWKFDKHYKLLFTVGSVLDLNTLPNIGNPVQSTDSKSVCCCCCESAPITATLRVDKTGYVPGECIVFDAEVQDGTGTAVRDFAPNLRLQRYGMVLLYNFRYTTIPEDGKEVGRLSHGPVAPGGNDVWRREKLRIPSLPPSFLPGCNLMEIHYFLEMIVDVADTPFDLKTSVGIVVGTVPLRSVVQNRRPERAMATRTTQPLGASAPVDFDMPPPSYRECVLGQANTMEEDEQHAQGNMNFAPSYSYYDWL